LNSPFVASLKLNVVILTKVIDVTNSDVTRKNFHDVTSGLLAASHMGRVMAKQYKGIVLVVQWIDLLPG